MMDFIFIPLVVGIITLGIYKLFELFVRKKERLLMIEKMAEHVDFSKYDFTLPQLSSSFKNYSFGSLKIGCLLIGLGLGLLVGFIIIFSTGINGTYGHDYESKSAIYGASVLLFGGIGLLAAFLIEQKCLKKDQKKE